MGMQAVNPWATAQSRGYPEVFLRTTFISFFTQQHITISFKLYEYFGWPDPFPPASEVERCQSTIVITMASADFGFRSGTACVAIERYRSMSRAIQKVILFVSVPRAIWRVIMTVKTNPSWIILAEVLSWLMRQLGARQCRHRLFRSCQKASFRCPRIQLSRR